MTRAYEAVYIFDSALEDAAINEKMTKHHALLGATGEIALNHWGRRQLAYKIGSKESGYYIVAKFECDPTALPEFKYETILRDKGYVPEPGFELEHDWSFMDPGTYEKAKSGKPIVSEPSRQGLPMPLITRPMEFLARRAIAAAAAQAGPWIPRNRVHARNID